MSNSSVEQIKERLSIVDVISSYLKLEKAGANYKAVCPFHSEKTPSFFISPARSSYYCFGCGAKGDIFTFVEQFEGLDFKGALSVLALRAGVEITAYKPEEKNEKDRLYQLMENATIFFQKKIAENTEASTYVEGRGVTKETLALFRIGYAPNEWRELTSAMREKGFNDEELLRAGLAKHPDNNPKGEIYDRFRDRIMFPISDTGGRIIAFSGRILHQVDGDVQGKYINSPETPIFKKGSTLYGLDKAKFEIRKRDSAILVEGQMDLVLSHQAGFTNTVASSGTALADSLVADADKGLLSGLGQVHGLSKNLIVAFDADKAGMRAAARAEKIGLSLGMNVKIAKLPKGLDPADVIRASGATGWKKIIDAAQHIISFYLSVLDEHSLSPHTRMRAVRERILPYVALMPSAVERAHFIKEIQRATSIPEDALQEDVSSIIASGATGASTEKNEIPIGYTRTTRIQERLFAILIWQESGASSLIPMEPFRQRFRSILGENVFTQAYENALHRKSEYIFEAELLYQNEKRLSKEVEELLDNLEEETLTRALLQIVERISVAEKNDTTEALKKLLEESQTITQRLNTIKSSRFLN